MAACGLAAGISDIPFPPSPAREAGTTETVALIDVHTVHCMALRSPTAGGWRENCIAFQVQLAMG